MEQSVAEPAACWGKARPLQPPAQPYAREYHKREGYAVGGCCDLSTSVHHLVDKLGAELGYLMSEDTGYDVEDCITLATKGLKLRAARRVWRDYYRHPFARQRPAVFLLTTLNPCLAVPAAGTVFARSASKFRPLAVGFNGQIRKATPFSFDSAGRPKLC